MSDISRRSLLNSALAATALSMPASSCAAQTAGDSELVRLTSARRILLKGAIVLTLDPAVGDFAQGDVLIDNGKIAQIASRIDAPAESTAIAEMPNRIIIPGFIDTHVHSYQGLLRSLLPAGIVDPDYNRDIQNNLTLHYRPEDVYAGVLITALAQIDNGTTTIVDISQISHSPEHSDADIQALKDSGIRAVFAYSRGQGPASRYPDDFVRLRSRYFNSPDQLLTIAFATSTDPKSFRFARAQGARSVLHIRVNSAPLIALSGAGLLRPGDEYIHCTHLSPEAWAAIRDSGGRTSHAPPLEMAMGHGYPAIQDALDHGLRPSLSSDHSATVAQDMFGIMRAAFDLQRLAVLQRAMRKEQNLPPLLTPRDVLSFATIEGARCAALDAKSGTLSPGKDADIVVLRADKLDVWPRNNAYSTVASLMNPGHVEAVFIAGKVKKWGGVLVGVDTSRIMAMVEQSRDGVLQRGAFTPNLLG